MLGYAACVPLVIRLHADPRRVRAEISSRGISLEEEAAVAVVYRRPRRRELPCAVLAVGRDAIGMSGGVRFTDPSLVVTEEDRRARVVPLERAAWWNGGKLVEAGARVEPAHIGEILVVRPFARETFSPPLCAALLRYMEFLAMHRSGGVPWWWSFRGLFPWSHRVDISLDAVPDDDASHDALVRELRPFFGASATLGGAPLRVRRPRGLADLRPRHLADLAALFAGGALLFALRPPRSLTDVRAVGLGWLLGFALVVWYRRFRYE